MDRELKERIEGFMESCCRRNETVAHFAKEEGSLRDFLKIQAGKNRANKKLTPLLPKEDALKALRQYLESRVSADIADGCIRSWASGAIATADHHGGFYSAQAFQGDLLFRQLLREEGMREEAPDAAVREAIPYLTTSQVDLDNSTFARGILAYGSETGRQQFSLMPKSREREMVACSRAYNKDELARVLQTICKKKELKPMADIVSEIYGRPELLGMERYADQLFAVGLELGNRALAGFASEGTYAPSLCYVEMEEALRPLFLKELGEPSSILYRMFFDPALRKALDEVKTEDGITLSCLLFMGSDARGRKVHVHLAPDGSLEGISIKGEHFTYGNSVEEIRELMEERKLLVSGYAAALMLVFERGFTWYGGVFQSVYLSKWKELTCKVLRMAGMEEEADRIAAYDCTGYISGPVYALNEFTVPAEDEAGERYGTAAGPLEFIQMRPDEGSFDRWMDTGTGESHYRGLFEIYYDLHSPEGREEGWYRTIAAWCGERIDRTR
ncbi:MAG: hypothetical protein IK115_03470 [Lachnospiraceae bacterium]|nr:hypothetical protein [Lachnospiraceae bacterium]